MFALIFFPTWLLGFSAPTVFSCVQEKRKSPLRSIVLHIWWMNRRTTHQWILSYFLIIVWQKYLVGSLNTSWSTEAPRLHKMGAHPVLISGKNACKCPQGRTGNGTLEVCSVILLLNTTWKWAWWHKVQLVCSECILGFFFCQGSVLHWLYKFLSPLLAW